MVKAKNTVEPTGKDNQQWAYLAELSKSPLFYLSAGSKELFHSDFLYWLADSCPKVFMRVMRVLAGRKEDQKFWWEDRYSVEAGNLEIRRESKHFDLAIYIFPKRRWLPVLVLENKVKSLPYAEQLKKYSRDAEKEWGNKREKNEEITFILLSLTNAKRLRNHSDYLGKWSFKQYNDLAAVLEKNLRIFNRYQLQLCRDYCNFIRALFGLAKYWKVNGGDNYLFCLCPQAIKDIAKNDFNAREPLIKDRHSRKNT